MELDLKAFLQRIPDDTGRIAEFLVRLENEGPSIDLWTDVGEFLQTQLDASADALGVPKLSEDDSRLDGAKQAALATTQKAMSEFEATMAGLDKQATELQAKAAALTAN